MKVRPKLNTFVLKNNNNEELVFKRDCKYEAFLVAGGYNVHYKKDLQVVIPGDVFHASFVVVNTCFDCGKEWESDTYEFRCAVCEEKAFGEYCSQVSEAYWAQEAEQKQ